MDYLEVDRGPGPSELAHPGLSAQAGRIRSLSAGLRNRMPITIGIAALTLWEIGVRVGAIDSLHFPAPSTIAVAFGESVADGVVIGHLFATLMRVAWGVGVGGTLGLLLGVAMGRSVRLKAALDPFVAAFHPLPKIAILPLIMVLFGIGDLTLVIVIAAGTFFPMLINTMAGVSQINPIHFDVARIHRAGKARVMFRVVLPGSAPSVLAGLRLALNTALLIAVAVEMVAARSGLGAMIWMSWVTLRTEDIFVALVVTVAFGLTVNLAISLIARWAVPWQQVGGD